MKVLPDYLQLLGREVQDRENTAHAHVDEMQKILINAVETQNI
jgi:hypothetical protein